MSAVTKSNLAVVPTRINIGIGPGGVPTVDQDPVTVDRLNYEEVEWVGANGQGFYVCFVDESPFEQRHFHSSNSRSGQATAGATGRYKYSVEINGKILDPTIIIKP